MQDLVQVWQPSISRVHPGRPIFCVLFLTRPCLQLLTSCLSLHRGALTEASNSPATVTQPGNVVTVSQTSITSASQKSITSASPTPVTSASPICPAANGSTYTASNKPPPAPAPWPTPWQLSNLTLSFEIFCNTNFLQGNLIRDLQVVEGISSLSDCLDQCALYSFRTREDDFPALGCLGVAWDNSGYDLCWLKSNVTLGSLNGAKSSTSADGAVLLDV